MFYIVNYFFCIESSGTMVNISFVIKRIELNLVKKISELNGD